MKPAERTMIYGIVAGLVVSQANLALFEDLVHHQASFDAVGWGNWFLFLVVPILAGGLVLYYGRTNTAGAERKPERALAASVLGLLVVTVVLRVAVPAILHVGDVLPDRLPRTLADGFSFVAQYCRIAPQPGQGRYSVAAAMVSGSAIVGAVAFGALAFERRWLSVLVSGMVGAVWPVVGWFVPGGAGLRIIGSLWPIVFLGSVGLVLGVFETRGSKAR